jgi:twinkle protein
MSKDYKDFGIEGINPGGSTEQRTSCPQPACRGKEHKKNLAVNIEIGAWQCFRCGWTGSLNEGEGQQKTVFNDIGVPTAEISQDTVEKKSGIQRIADYCFTRKIRLETLLRNKVGYSNDNGKDTICFNYYILEKKVNIKYRNLDKEFRQVTKEKGAKKVYYKLNDILFEDTAIVTEGEFDALAFEEAGYKNAISIPDGAIPENAKTIDSKLEFIENCAEYTEHIQKYYLAMDTDGPGLRMREELARRYGKEKCWIIEYPEDCKDANDVLINYGAETLAECVKNAEPYPYTGVFLVNKFAKEILDLYENGFPKGPLTGVWQKEFDRNIKSLDSLLVTITGIPSHGKTIFLNNWLTHLAVSNNYKTAFFTPEHKRIYYHTANMLQILVGKRLATRQDYEDKMSRDELQMAMEFSNEHFYYVKPDSATYKIDSILEHAGYLVKKFGINALVIDAWSKIDHEGFRRNESETSYIGRTLNQMYEFCDKHNVTIFLIAHPTKKRKNGGGTGLLYEVPNLYDISGSAHFYNTTDIGMSVYRRFQLEDNQGNIVLPGGERKASRVNYDFSTTEVRVLKSRETYMGKLGMATFEFEEKSKRFFEPGNLFEGNLFDWSNQQVTEEKLDQQASMIFGNEDKKEKIALY